MDENHECDHGQCNSDLEKVQEELNSANEYITDLLNTINEIKDLVKNV